jgi:hypothetical protein
MPGNRVVFHRGWASQTEFFQTNQRQDTDSNPDVWILRYSVSPGHGCHQFVSLIIQFIDFNPGAVLGDGQAIHHFNMNKSLIVDSNINLYRFGFPSFSNSNP